MGLIDQSKEIDRQNQKSPNSNKRNKAKALIHLNESIMESTVQHTHDSCQKLEPGSVLLRTARSETYANEKGSSTDTLTKDISGRLDHSH